VVLDGHRCTSLRFVTVTKRKGSGERSRCEWCSRPLPERPADRVGRKPKYCRRSCRQRAFEARRRGEQLGVADDELVITRNELDDVNDRLFEVAAVVRDAQLQLEAGLSPTKVLEHLLVAVDSVVGTN